MKNKGNELFDLDLDELRRELDGLIDRLEGEARPQVFDALGLAEEVHSEQVRDNGTPYLAHPLRVALSLAWELGVSDAELLCAALLHDAAEDAKQTTLPDISAAFGERVGGIVQVLTKPSDSRLTREQINQIYFSRLLDANEDCKLVKLADKLDNVRDAVNSPDLTKRIRTAEEARDFYLELASSLSAVQRRETILALLQLALKALAHQTAVE